MLNAKEHQDLIGQFEKEHTGRFAKEPRDLWARGRVYQGGHVNDLFLSYRRGYAYGKATGSER